jgi:nanoRNase/pAp phosphatase (c-di-AMP/oligoRNAs hydrolase)
LTKTNICNMLDGHRGERHVVVLHDYPDPDAIASAYAHRLISAEYDIDKVKHKILARLGVSPDAITLTERTS